MEFVKIFTPLDFQAKNFTPSISHNFNSFNDKNTKKWVKMEKFTLLAKILHCCWHWRHWQIPTLTGWHDGKSEGRGGHCRLGAGGCEGGKFSSNMLRAVTEMFKIISVITMIKVIMMNRVIRSCWTGYSWCLVRAHWYQTRRTCLTTFFSIALNVGGIKFRATCIRTKTLPQSENQTFGFSNYELLYTYSVLSPKCF